MARKTIHIVKDTFSNLYFYVDNDIVKSAFPFTLEIHRSEMTPMYINIDIQEYDALIEALIKHRITNFPEKEFKCMLSK